MEHCALLARSKLNRDNSPPPTDQSRRERFNMPTGSYSVSFSLPVGITPRRQPEIEYNNSTLDGAMCSLCVLGRCLGSGGPWRIREPTFGQQPEIKYNNDA